MTFVSDIVERWRNSLHKGLINKKISVVFVLLLVVGLFYPSLAFANMSAPLDSDLGSSITFEKNNEISVLSEVLDIRVDGAQAEITARYSMKNTTDVAVSTDSMFISPNIERANVEVVVNQQAVEYSTQSYELNYDADIQTNDWNFAVLNDSKNANENGRMVDTILFNIAFLPNQQLDVVVSYIYNLGGYPTLNFDVKRGVIEYLLTPANMWKDFENLTINLYLDKDMPIVTSSNVEFEKVAARTYQYVSDSLPEQDLIIEIDQNAWQSFWSFFRNPYLMFFLPVLIPIVLIFAIILYFVIKKIKKNRKTL